MILKFDTPDHRTAYVDSDAVDYVKENVDHPSTQTLVFSRSGWFTVMGTALDVAKRVWSTRLVEE